MTQDRKPPNPARRNQRSRQAILSATADLLGEVGYTKLTVEAIAATRRAASSSPSFGEHSSPTQPRYPSSHAARITRL